MKLNYTIGSIYHIAKADFLQRVRSDSFLVGLMICIFLIYSFVPALNAGYNIILLGNYRGAYNSAWIGAMVANCGPFFALIGFYLVNYAVKRDVDTGVGQIIATTRINRIQYLFGKLCSNFAVLLLILVVVAIMTVIMFWVRGETNEMELEKLLSPLLRLTVPTLFITACLALFFDALPSYLRRLSNVAYFILWLVIIGISEGSSSFDIFNMYTFVDEIKQSIAAVHSDWNGNYSTGIIVKHTSVELKVFTWEGMTWTTTILKQRMYWMLAALGLVLLVSLSFNRFDSSKIKLKKAKKSKASKKKIAQSESNIVPPRVRFRDVPMPVANFSFLALLRAELRLMLKGNSTLWLLFSTGLFISSIFAPIDFAYKIAIPLLWVFQMLILSKLGSREIRHRSNEYIFSAAFPLRRQFPAMLTAAILVLLLPALPVVLRVLFNGDIYGVYAIIVGALFISAFAIFLGVVTKGGKTFEVMFSIIVYSYLYKVPYFDFIGGVEASRAFGMAHYLLVLSIAFILLAIWARKRQIRDSY